MHHAFTLDNGLRVIVKEDHRAPIVSTQMWYHVGSSYEYPGQSGLSHALEHLLYSGSSKLATGQYSRILQRIGATENAFTTQDASVFHQLLPRARLEPALEMAADVMATATLPAVAFAREIEVIKAERSMRIEHSPEALLREAMTAQAFAMCSYRTPVIGTAADLARMDIEELRHWYRTWYAPNNATLVLCGDVEPSAVETLVKRHFGALPRAALATSKRPRELERFGERSFTLKLPGATPSLSLAFNVPSHGTSTDVRTINALHLTRYLLTEGIGARVPSRLLRDRELITYVQSEYAPYSRGDQLLRITVGLNSAKAVDRSTAEAGLWELLQSLKTTAPDEQELERARTKLTAAAVYASDDIEYQAERLGQLAAAGLSPTLLDTEMADLHSIGPQDIQQAAQTFFIRERLTSGYLTSREDTHE
jgi:zinc protease